MFGPPPEGEAPLWAGVALGLMIGALAGLGAHLVAAIVREALSR